LRKFGLVANGDVVTLNHSRVQAQGRLTFAADPDSTVAVISDADGSRHPSLTSFIEHVIINQLHLEVGVCGLFAHLMIGSSFYVDLVEANPSLPKTDEESIRLTTFGDVECAFEGLKPRLHIPTTMPTELAHSLEQAAAKRRADSGGAIDDAHRTPRALMEAMSNVDLSRRASLLFPGSRF
jgi:hypothetical protein